MKKLANIGFAAIMKNAEYNRQQMHTNILELRLENGTRGITMDVREKAASEKRLIGFGKGFKHGYFYKPWYPNYKSMMERCYLPTAGNYKRYGGKGITVCEEWHDINKFAEWAEISGYIPGLTIDRIDSNKGYSPDNCRWATKKQQSNNRKNTIFYTYKGETKALTDWASLYGINRYTLYDRIEKRGWSVEKALETPVGTKKWR